MLDSAQSDSTWLVSSPAPVHRPADDVCEWKPLQWPGMSVRSYPLTASDTQD